MRLRERIYKTYTGVHNENTGAQMGRTHAKKKNMHDAVCRKLNTFYLYIYIYICHAGLMVDQPPVSRVKVNQVSLISSAYDFIATL